MKRLVSLLAVLAFVFLGSFVQAQPVAEASGVGRPDPTGRGRYLQFGKEQEFPGAKVLKDLPEGAACAPAGELVGVPLWNSTREGHAIVSKLTNKAEVATSDKGVFLCWCVDGFNQLFPPELKQANIAGAVAQAIDRRVIGEMDLKIGGTVEVHHSGLVQVQIVPPPATTAPKEQEDQKKGRHWGTKSWIATVLAVIGTGIVISQKDDSKPATRTPNPKVYTNPTGWLGLSITLPLGGS